MISCACEQHGAELSLLLQTIQRVTRAPSPPDAQIMHATILYIVAQPLTACLRQVQKQNPKRNDIDLIISNLKPYVDFRRRAFTPCPELQTWRAQGGIRQSLKSTFQGLIIWGAGGGQQLSPPHYNPRLILIADCILGAPTTLHILLEEIKSQTEAPDGNAAIALDIATSFICAPKSENSPIHIGWAHSPLPVPPVTGKGTKRLSLREALKLEFENATELVQRDSLMAETVVRLYRAVEAQLDFEVAPLPDTLPSLLPLNGDGAAVGDQGGLFGTDDNAASMGLGGSGDLGLGGSGGMDLGGAEGMDLGLGDGLMGDLKMDGTDDLFGETMKGVDDDDDVFGGLVFDNLEGMGDSDYYQ